jgi:hypothetical protein
MPETSQNDRDFFSDKRNLMGASRSRKSLINFRRSKMVIVKFDDSDVDDESTTRGSSADAGASSCEDIAKDETRLVIKQRLLVGTVLVLAATMICNVVYFITSGAQHREFKAHFEGGADKILTTFNDIVREHVGAVGSLCLSLTARGIEERSTSVNYGTVNTTSPSSWPFVTMDAFQERASSARILSKVLHMSVLPVVQENQREEWEAYSVANSQWYVDGFAYQDNAIDSGVSRRKMVGDNDNTGNATAVTEFHLFKPYIYDYTANFSTIPANGPAPFTPVWQSSPLTFLDGVNLDLRRLGRQGDLVSLCMETKEVVFGGFFIEEPGNSSHPNIVTAWYSSLLSTAAGHPVDYTGDPIIEASYPIFSDFSDKREVVGVMMFQFSWQTYFEGILPRNSEGFMLVLENECDGAYSYIIEGGHVRTLGFGDLHISEFDDMASFRLLDDGMLINDGSREGVKLNLAGCPYVLRVYPTERLRDKYCTSMPILLTLAIAGAFVFTIAMFIMYDRLVERRNKMVL